MKSYKIFVSLNLKFAFVALLLSFGLFSNSAQALPAFARQTGMECAACHVGSFGPQLTPYGRQFKLNGYVWGDTDNPTKGLSAMVYGGFEHTKSDMRKGIELTDSQRKYKANDNATLDQASIFYGGRITPNLGTFLQATYSDPSESFSWDNMDVRYADNTDIGGKSLVYGVTVNNNPTMQDLWNTTPAWRFPYLSSSIAPAPAASPYIENMGQQAGGIGIYGMYDDTYYAEISGYKSLPHHTLLALGVTGADKIDRTSSVSPYARIGVQKTIGNSYIATGVYGIAANIYPGDAKGNGTDKYLDYALDATYQYTNSNGDSTFSLYGSALRENQKFDSTFSTGGSTNRSNNLTELEANASYYYNNTYGVTLRRFDILGSRDALLYPDASSHKPDSTGWTAQLDFTPFGTANSPGGTFMNHRFYVQYTAYDKFNGQSHNYDGTGRNASDNNTIFVGDWIAF